MSSAEPTNPAPGRISEDGLLWQLLKAYANEDWDRRAAPWPAPANAFLADASANEARALAAELDALLEALPDGRAWRGALEAEQIDWRGLAPESGLRAWASDLQARASDAGS